MTALTSRPAATGADRPHRQTYVETVMGIPVSVTVRGLAVRQGRGHDAVAAAFASLHAADATFSTYKDDSPVLQMQRGLLDLADAPADLQEVFALCEKAEERTGGAFTALLPAGTGAERDVEDLVFDPTGLVKGWALARAGRLLAQEPGIAWCVNAGGDIVGGRADVADEADRSWRFGIEDPRTPGRVVRTVELGSGAMATSGTAQRGRHLYDPRTGGSWPAREGSVTVIGGDIMWADVWATACWVGGSFTDELMSIRQPGYEVVRL